MEETDPPVNPVDKMLMVRRTLMPFVWAYIIGLASELGWDGLHWLDNKPLLLMLIQTVLAGLLYLIALILGPRWPWVEQLILSSKQRPTEYVEPPR